MADRLSELPDDLLRRVLHFAPLKEAASTTALSRRWRAPLWLSSAAVNLEACVEYHRQCAAGDISSLLLLPSNEAFITEAFGRDTFLTEAVAALDTADVPVTRLTLRLESDHHEAVEDFLTRDTERDEDGILVSRDKDLVQVLLSRRAASLVEEFRLIFKVRTGYRIDYKVALDDLPLETLRVLELTNCQGLYAAPLVLPRLSSLRLRNCAQRLGSLQRAIDSAPTLTYIRLDSVYIYADPTRPRWPKIGRLRCPAASMLVLDRCCWEETNICGEYQAVDGVEIEAPRLRRFMYKGRLGSLSFSSQPVELEQLGLDHERCATNPDLDSETFWRLARSFTRTKEMRLLVNHLEEVAVLTEARRVELLPAFRHLWSLVLLGVYWMKCDTAAVTIVNLLRCCPVLRALHISLTAEHRAVADASKKKGPRSRIPQKIMQLPALGPHHSLKCLQSSLTRVRLQFWRDESNCFGLKLIEFFAENAMVLEEMVVNKKFCEHMTRNTERWNSKRRKSGATCFKVLTFKR